MCEKEGGGINDTQFVLLSWSYKHIVIRFQTAPDKLLQRNIRGSETGQSTKQSKTETVHTAF